MNKALYKSSLLIGMIAVGVLFFAPVRAMEAESTDELMAPTKPKDTMEAEETREMRGGTPNGMEAEEDREMRGNSPKPMEADSTDELMSSRDSASGQSTGRRQFGGEDQGDNITTNTPNADRQQGPPSINKPKGPKGRSPRGGGR